jgi:hypothetical protein
MFLIVSLRLAHASDACLVSRKGTATAGSAVVKVVRVAETARPAHHSTTLPRLPVRVVA